MFRIMKSGIVAFFLLSIVYGSKLSLKETTKDQSTQVNVTETERANSETVSIDVQQIQVDRDQNGGFQDARILKVNIRVSVVDGVVHVNNTKAIHKAVTTFHFYAEIDEIGKNREVLQHMTRVPIVIRVLVNESEQINEQEVFKVLQVQEEIVEVDNKAVKQIKVTQLVLKLDSANNELISKRVITKIELKDSAVHKMPHEKDNHKYPDGHLPDNPYSDPSNPKPKPAQLPDHPLEADTSKDGLCSKFHKLPFAARLAIFAVVALIGIGTFTCCLWVFCCKPPASGKKIDLKDFEDKFAYDGEFEAPALEQKVPIEKQKLVIDA